MANGKITLGKQAGGTLGLVFPDGISNTEVVLPESGILATKQYVDDADYLQPTLTTNATLTGNDNKIVMTGIVSTLGLEVGDVIQFTSGTNAQNAKMRTVESITNNNEIVVNYEHCGSRGNGSLKLSDQAGISCTVKRVAKYYNAFLGLGQDYVDVSSLRANNTIKDNLTNRTINILVSSTVNNATVLNLYTDDVIRAQRSFTITAGAYTAFVINDTINVKAGSTYKLNGLASGFLWLEMR